MVTAEVQMQERVGELGYVVTLSAEGDAWTSPWVLGGPDEARSAVQALYRVLGCGSK